MSVEVRGDASVTGSGHESERTLLLRYRPLLVWDSQEEFRALAVDSIIDNPGNHLEVDGRIIAQAGNPAGDPLSLALLAREQARGPKPQLKEAGYPRETALAFLREGCYPDRAYGRLVSRGERTYVQYWFWMYYCDGTPSGVGHHEGDWQMIQVALSTATKEPTCVTCTQGLAGAERSRTLGDIQWEPCPEECVPGCRHPRVYVAPFSHA